MIELIIGWLMGEKIVGNSESSKWSVLGIFSAVTAFLAGLVEGIIFVVDMFLDQVDTFLTESFPSADLSMLPDTSVINAFFPLNESIVTFTLVLGLWSVVIVIRWLKSLIPTASN